MKFVTVSFVKKYNKEKNLLTSEQVFQPMNNLIETVLDVAQINAVKDGRKTVMGRDIEAALQDGMAFLLAQNQEMKATIAELENKINYLENP